MFLWAVWVGVRGGSRRSDGEGLFACSLRNKQVSLERQAQRGRKVENNQKTGWLKLGGIHRVRPNLRIRRVEERYFRCSQPCPRLSSHISTSLVSELT